MGNEPIFSRDEVPGTFADRDHTPPRRPGRPPRAETDNHRLPSPVQRQARALGDPTRYKIFRYVADAAEPVGVTAIAAHLRLHHTAIRQHLAKLCEADLLVRAIGAQKTWGRPAYLYEVAPDTAGLWGTPTPHEQLAFLLLEVIRSGGHPRAVGVSAGRDAARRDGTVGADPVQTLEAEVARRGFSTQRDELGDGLDLLFPTCPFAAAADAAPEVVCELHRGLAEGLLSAMGGTVRVVDLVIRPTPESACRLRLQRASNGEG